MCSFAPPPTALGLDFHAAAGARACLDRHRGRGVAVAVAVAPAACGAMARESVRRAGAVVSSAPTQKRSRQDREGFAAGGEACVVPAPGQQRRFEERMRAELDAIRVLHRKALLLSKSKTSPLKRAPEAAQQRSTEPVKKQRATPAPTKSSVAKPLDKAREILKRRRLEEMAQEREKFRQEVLEMARAALPDETIYPRDLQELGIAFEYAMTRTWRQAHGHG